MKHILCALVYLLVTATATQAQFNFHWAFPYFVHNNMEVKNGNKNILVFTKNKEQNGFKQAQLKNWGKTNGFYYAKSLNEITLRSYKFICTDGTIAIADIEKLHNEMPKNVLFFIHRTAEQWSTDVELLQRILLERPGWAYGGNPYDPKTPIIRSNKSIFLKYQIILGREAPGEGL